MTRFRKKPLEVEAVRWTLENMPEVKVFLSDEVAWSFDADGVIIIETLEGRMAAHPGDWIIKGVEGEFYPCKDSVFRATYEQVQP